MANFLSKAGFILRNVIFRDGTDYSGVSGGSNQPTGVSMGGFQYPASGVPDSYFNSDARHLFGGTPQYDPSGYDSMAGVNFHPQPGQLEQSDMYAFDLADNDPEANSIDFGLAREYPGGDPLQPGSTEYNYPLGNPYQPGGEE